MDPTTQSGDTTTAPETGFGTNVGEAGSSVFAQFANQMFAEEAVAAPETAKTEPADNAERGARAADKDGATTSPTDGDSERNDLSKSDQDPEETPRAEEDGDISPEVQERINKRIGKAVAKAKEAEERAQAAQRERDELEARLRDVEAKTERAPRNANEALAHVEDGRALEAEAVKAQDAFDEADKYLLRLGRRPELVARELKAAGIKLTNPDTGEEDYSEERMENFLFSVKSNAQRLLRSEIPKRQQWLVEQARHGQTVVERFPEFKDPASELHKTALRLVTERPELKRRSDWPVLVAKLALGEQAYGGKAKEKTTAAPAQVPPRIPAAPRPAPAARKGPAPVDYDKIAAGDRTERSKHFDQIATQIVGGSE
jgi:hypothetical protein